MDWTDKISDTNGLPSSSSNSKLYTLLIQPIWTNRGVKVRVLEVGWRGRGGGGREGRGGGELGGREGVGGDLQLPLM